MSSSEPQQPPRVTELLAGVRRGDHRAEAELLPLVYAELRELAQAVFSDQKAGHTLQPTALVHEAWLKLSCKLGSLDDRRHFFVVAGKAMRQVLCDHARARGAKKRGESAHRVTLDTNLVQGEDRAVDLIDLSASIDRLAERNERHAKVAELRLFSGLSIQEAADLLGLSPRSVDSDWAMAKAWLRKDLAGSR